MTGLTRFDIDLMGAPMKLFGFPDDGYFAQVAAYIPQNTIFISEATKLDKDAVIIDVGANIGITTIIGAACVPHGRVISLEPSPRAFTCLRAVAVENNLLNCAALNVAASAEPGTVSFVESPFLAGSYIGGATRDAKTTDVSAITLDSLIDSHDLTRVDLIKIDVEGFELDVLQGATDIIERFNPVFVMEFNSYAICYNRNISPRMLLDFILDRYGGFRVSRDGIETTVATNQQVRDFMFSNMASRACVDDIVFGG
ncbi:MAG: FkbM family methyltransferase [Mesorhizobium sp.]|nr:MAG: FkbM family methyltransferase [Mesorhizobium sp.]